MTDFPAGIGRTDPMCSLPSFSDAVLSPATAKTQSMDQIRTMFEHLVASMDRIEARMEARLEATERCAAVAQPPPRPDPDPPYAEWQRGRENSWWHATNTQPPTQLVPDPPFVDWQQGRGESARNRPLMSAAAAVAYHPHLGFAGAQVRDIYNHSEEMPWDAYGPSRFATHQPLNSKALCWDRYGSSSEGVRGRRPTAWDNPEHRVDDHAGRLAPTWETAWGRHEGGRYSDQPRRIDASERRATIPQPPPRPDPDPPDTDWQRGREESGRQRAVLTPAPAVASIPRLGFGDDSSFRGPQQATQPGASPGPRYTVKGDGDRGKQPSASVAIEAPSSSTTDLLLQVKDHSAVIAESKQPILKGVNLTVRHGEVHAAMGKNGSGKSTIAKVLAGHPDYEVTGGSVMYKGLDLREMEPEERATAGLFMSFPSSVEIHGVSYIKFLNMAYNARRRKIGLPELGPIEFYGYVAPKLELVNIKTDFLNRCVNEGFSGGNKKHNEILQLAVLGAEFAILDEIDSGLDVDALQDVAKAVNGILTSKNSVLMITHYLRLLEFITPTYIHVMENGRFVKTGDITIAEVLENEGRRSVVRCAFDPGGDVAQ